MDMMDRRTVLRTGIMAVVGSAIADANGAEAASEKAKVERALEKAKRSLPEIMAFINAMPKGGDIHNHLEGGIYDIQALRSAMDLGLNYDLGTDSFTGRAIGNGVVSAREIERDDSLYLRFRDRFSVRRSCRTGHSGREQFFRAFGRFQSSRISLAEVIAGMQRRASIEKISYVETIAPVVPDEWIERLSRVAAGASSRGIEHMLEAMHHALNSPEYRDAISRRLDGWGATSAQVEVRYLAYALRFFPLDQFLVQAACAMAAVKADGRIVGFNLVGPEDSVVANRDFLKQIEIVDALWERYDRPNIALHAGEFTQNEVTVEDLRGRIRQSISLGHARRIGHGVSIAWDDERGETLTMMRQQNIPVEICLTSNEVILGISGRSHPIDLYRSAGIPIVYGSDDEGITRSSLTSELAKAVFRHDLSYAELRNSVRNSLEYSFLEGSSMFVNGDYNRARRRIRGETRAGPALVGRESSGRKADLQRRLEGDLAAFEATF